MKFQLKFRLLLLKTYFDTGLGLTNYIKYFIAFFALASKDIFWTIFFGLAYALSCFIIGFIWYHYKWIEVQNEVSNRYNPFVKEMRRKIKRKI